MLHLWRTEKRRASYTVARLENREEKGLLHCCMTGEQSREGLVTLLHDQRTEQRRVCYTAALVEDRAEKS